MNYIAWFDVILQTVSSIYQLHSCELQTQVHSTWLVQSISGCDHDSMQVCRYQWDICAYLHTAIYKLKWEWVYICLLAVITISEINKLPVIWYGNIRMFLNVVLLQPTLFHVPCSHVIQSFKCPDYWVSLLFWGVIKLYVLWYHKVRFEIYLIRFSTQWQKSAQIWSEFINLCLTMEYKEIKRQKL